MMKQQNRTQRFRAVFLLCLALALLLCACAEKVPAFEKKGEEYVHPETKNAYYAAPWNYEAVDRVANKPVVRIAQDKIDDIVLYEIEEEDSSRYLSTEHYDLFYSARLTLPTLAEMNPSSVLVCQGADRSFVVETLTGAQDVAAILAAVDARPLSSFEGGGDYEVYTLKFASEQYSAFYYRLTYRQYDAPIETWVQIEDADHFEVLYENAEVRVEEYKGELYAVYTFGVGVIYDETADAYYAVGDVIAKHLQTEKPEANV